MKKILFSLIALILILFPSYIDAQSQVESTPSVKVKVERVANVMERFKEKISLFLKFSAKDKVALQQELTEKRLAELDYVIQSGQGDLIEETSSRYRTYVGGLIKSTKSDQVQDMKTQLLEMGENHQKILAPLRDNFESNSGFWLLVQQDIDIVRDFTNQIRSL